MKMLHRRATCGTHSILRVPEWHVIRDKRAKNHLIWHAFLGIIENARVPKWHITLLACFIFNKPHTTCKDMINFQFQYCNHRCEVCGEKIPSISIAIGTAAQKLEFTRTVI